MLWILIDVAIALAALAVLAVLVLGLWRKVKALSATVAASGEAVTEATDRLTAAQLAGSPGGAQPTHARRPPPDRRLPDTSTRRPPGARGVA